MNSVFATGLSFPLGMAFDPAGNLYVADGGTNTIYRYTTAGVRSTFVTGNGMNLPSGIAFDPAGNLFVANLNGGNILRFTPGGAVSTFATGLSSPTFLAFDQGAVPEPATWVALVVGGGVLWVFGRRRRAA
ncbi:MAG: SMP-30/gluconolactonase/LRE family protein [Rhodospirillales bacterium]|nr:SMP-30/gluconolactonase/LRE family protein [Acetobacter sp.]